MNNFQQDTLNDINESLKLTLTLNDVVFSAPTLIDASVLTFEDPTRRNSVVEITLKDPTLIPDFLITCYYNRLQLQKLSRLRSLQFQVSDDTRLHDYLPLLSERFQVPITADDIEDAPIDLSNLPTTVTIRAKPQSSLLFGELQVDFDDYINIIELTDTQGRLLYTAEGSQIVGSASVFRQ